MVNYFKTRLKFTVDKEQKTFYWHLLGDQVEHSRVYLVTGEARQYTLCWSTASWLKEWGIERVFCFFQVKNNINDNNKNKSWHRILRTMRIGQHWFVMRGWENLGMSTFVVWWLKYFLNGILVLIKGNRRVLTEKNTKGKNLTWESRVVKCKYQNAWQI